MVRTCWNKISAGTSLSFEICSGNIPELKNKDKMKNKMSLS